jgi:hypothetical protein
MGGCTLVSKAAAPVSAYSEAMREIMSKTLLDGIARSAVNGVVE